MEKELLHPPVQELADIQHVFRRTGDLVNPSELLQLLPRLAEHAEHLALAVENRSTAVAAIGDVDVALRISRDVVRRVELARLVAGLAKRFQPFAVLVRLRDARIDVTIADVDVSRRIPRDVGDLPK